MPPLIPEVAGRRLIVPISRGCVGHCTYCIVKNALGALRSYPTENIIDYVKYALGKDFIELFITAQDTAIYGKDLPNDTNLIGLLRSILSLQGNFMLRIGMMTPNHAWEIREGLVDVLQDERVYQFIHLPLQSGDDKILKMMGRQYDSKLFIRLVRYFREKLPDLSVVTDVIVGFPEEDNNSFKRTIEVIQAIAPEKVNISRFTPRPHTLARSLPQINDSTKRSRSKQMTEICRAIYITKRGQLVGKTLKAIPLRKRDTFFYGRTSSFIPVVFEQNEFLRVGHMYRTYVTGVSESGIRGKTILESELD
jgi:MiaB/RimO family radical SAM methylthiotransferase